MAVRDIVLYPDDPLTKVSAPLDIIEPDVPSLVTDMFDTMDTYDGIGLSAPQVGVAKRITVMRDPENGKRICLINPEISDMEGTEYAEEGCLSLPHLFADVPRAVRIHVRAQDVDGKALDFVAHDWLARVIQHETDHLNGIVMLDRLDILSREGKLREWQEVRESMRATVEGSHPGT